MSTPTKTRSAKELHNTPPSNVTEKNAKGLNPEEDEYKVCIVCDRIILEPSESIKGGDAVFCKGDC